jgi:hypothetical protein
MAPAVWVFAGLKDVSMAGQQEIRLTNSFTLNQPDELLLSCRDRYLLCGRDWQQIENVSCFLLLREQAPPLRGPERDKHFAGLQNALMAFQVLKPLHTSGFIFQAVQLHPATLNLERIGARRPMDAGIWASMAPSMLHFSHRCPI